MKGNRYIFWLPKFFESLEVATKYAQEYKKFQELTAEDRVLLGCKEREINTNYRLYVLDLEHSLKSLELYTDENWSELLRILAMPDSFFAPQSRWEIRKRLIIRKLNLEEEFKFLANHDNFNVANWPYNSCEGCRERGSLCDRHYEQGVNCKWKDIKEWKKL